MIHDSSSNTLWWCVWLDFEPCISQDHNKSHFIVSHLRSIVLFTLLLASLTLWCCLKICSDKGLWLASFFWFFFKYPSVKRNRQFSILGRFCNISHSHAPSKVKANSANVISKLFFHLIPTKDITSCLHGVIVPQGPSQNKSVSSLENGFSSLVDPMQSPSCWPQVHRGKKFKAQLSMRDLSV